MFLAGLPIFGDFSNPVLSPTYLPTALSRRNSGEINPSSLGSFGDYRSALALQERVRQAMVSSTEILSSNASVGANSPQSNPLAYHMLGRGGLGSSATVDHQNGQWHGSQMPRFHKKVDNVKSKTRGRGGVRNDTCQYCGKVSSQFCNLLNQIKPIQNLVRHQTVDNAIFHQSIIHTVNDLFGFFSGYSCLPNSCLSNLIIPLKKSTCSKRCEIPLLGLALMFREELLDLSLNVP